MQKMARELKVDSETARNSVKYDLKLKSYTKTPKHLLTTAMRKEDTYNKNIFSYVFSCGK